jgi:hypothetical protein
MCFRNVDPILQAHVFQARKRWEQQRIHYGFSFEDSWVGSKLVGYLRAVGYEDVQEKKYRIVRAYPLCQDFRMYVEGIAQWFVGEGAPYLSQEYVTRWLACFSDQQSVINDAVFVYEETEYVVTGTSGSRSSQSRIRKLIP